MSTRVNLENLLQYVESVESHSVDYKTLSVTSTSFFLIESMINTEDKKSEHWKIRWDLKKIPNTTVKPKTENKKGKGRRDLPLVSSLLSITTHSLTYLQITLMFCTTLHSSHEY